MQDETGGVLKDVRINFDPKQKSESLSVSQMQSVEIAKAVSNDCRALIPDEPTRGIDVGA